MQATTVVSDDDIRERAKRDGITHLSTGVAILRNGKILMVRRAAGDYLGGVYELPGGGVDEGETITEGAIREVKEETGLTASKVLATFKGFDYSTDRKPRVRQINFLVEVEPGDVALNPVEHDDFIWVDKTTVQALNITESMRTCIRDALEVAGK